ncbi:MAG: hypothetical protein QNK37_14970 [Acidobacteriota bacterium]|nr:hypothetical protein [Acidobacteriota bacterium]
MTDLGVQNRRTSRRPPAHFEDPQAFSDNTVAAVAYIHIEGNEHAAEKPQTGLVNEYNEEGCSVILSEDQGTGLPVGTTCFLRLEPVRRGRAVVRWNRHFGGDACKIGFEFLG